MEWPYGITYRPIEAWPGELTRNRDLSPFSASLSSTLSLFQREIAAIQARSVVLQIALRESQFRIDGAPRAQAIPDHPGVILSLDTPDGALSFPCDTFTDWRDNLRAIVLTMEKLRAIDRYGVTKRGEQYTGWKALPATATAMPGSILSVQQALDVLYGEADMVVEPGVLYEPDALRRILRKAQFRAHPDTGGSDERIQRVHLAEEYLREHGAL